MAIITWSDKYSVNIPQIDAQHKRLVELINTLHDAMREGKGKEALGTVLKEMTAYTQTHFTHEEGLLRQHGYPGLLKHKRLHDTFTEKVLGLQTQFSSGAVIITLDLMTFLKDWLITHIQSEDQHYAPYLIARGVQ